MKILPVPASDKGVLTAHDIIKSQLDAFSRSSSRSTFVKTPSRLDKSREYIRDNFLVIFWGIAWLSANCTIFGYIFNKYMNSTFFSLLGYGICFARGTGYLLMFNIPLCVLMMCRWLFTVAEKWGVGHMFPFGRHVVAHKIIGWTTLPTVVIHVTAHYYNAYRLSIADPVLFSEVLGNHFSENPGFVGYLYTILPGVTGHIAFMFLCVLYACARDSVRIKNFEKFSIIHRSYMVVNFALMLHGRLELFESSKFIIFFSIPGAIYSLERFFRMLRGTKHRHVLDGTITKKNTIHLCVERQGLAYHPGQWGYVNFPGISALQWHPFTIVSHPEDPVLAFDIRPLGNWTQRLKDMLITPPGQGGKAKRVWMKFDGPFGASTLKALEKDVAVLVVSGIGVTRFISLIRQIKIIMLSAAIEQATGPPCRENFAPQMLPLSPIGSGQGPQAKRLLRVPRKVYLFWVCRERSFPDDFSWFIRDLKHDALKDIVETHIFWAAAPTELQNVDRFELLPPPALFSPALESRPLSCLSSSLPSPKRDVTSLHPISEAYGGAALTPTQARPAAVVGGGERPTSPGMESSPQGHSRGGPTRAGPDPARVEPADQSHPAPMVGVGGGGGAAGPGALARQPSLRHPGSSARSHWRRVSSSRSLLAASRYYDSAPEGCSDFDDAWVVVQHKPGADQSRSQSRSGDSGGALGRSQSRGQGGGGGDASPPGVTERAGKSGGRKEGDVIATRGGILASLFARKSAYLVSDSDLACEEVGPDSDPDLAPTGPADVFPADGATLLGELPAVHAFVPALPTSPLPLHQRPKRPGRSLTFAIVADGQSDPAVSAGKVDPLGQNISGAGKEDVNDTGSDGTAGKVPVGKQAAGRDGDLSDPVTSSVPLPDPVRSLPVHMSSPVPYEHVASSPPDPSLGANGRSGAKPALAVQLSGDVTAVTSRPDGSDVVAPTPTPIGQAQPARDVTTTCPEGKIADTSTQRRGSVSTPFMDDVTAQSGNIRYWRGKPDWLQVFSQLQEAYTRSTHVTGQKSAGVTRFLSTVTHSIRKRKGRGLSNTIGSLNASGAASPSLWPASNGTTEIQMSNRHLSPTNQNVHAHNAQWESRPDSRGSLGGAGPMGPSSTNPVTVLSRVSASSPAPNRQDVTRWSLPPQPTSPSGAGAYGTAASPGPAQVGVGVGATPRQAAQVGVYCSGTVWLYRDVTHVCREMNATRTIGSPEFEFERSE